MLADGPWPRGPGPQDGPASVWPISWRAGELRAANPAGSAGAAWSERLFLVSFRAPRRRGGPRPGLGRSPSFGRPMISIRFNIKSAQAADRGVFFVDFDLNPRRLSTRHLFISGNQCPATGRTAALFSRPEINAEVVMASACLPLLFRAGGG